MVVGYHHFRKPPYQLVKRRISEPSTGAGVTIPLAELLKGLGRLAFLMGCRFSSFALIGLPQTKKREGSPPFKRGGGWKITQNTLSLRRFTGDKCVVFIYAYKNIKIKIMKKYEYKVLSTNMENWTSLNQKACRKDRGSWHIAIPFWVESNLLGRTLQTSFQLTGTEFKPMNSFKTTFGDSQFSWHGFKNNYLVVSTHLKNISQIGSFPQVGVKIKNIWKNHPDKLYKHIAKMAWMNQPCPPSHHWAICKANLNVGLENSQNPLSIEKQHTPWKINMDTQKWRFGSDDFPF